MKKNKLLFAFMTGLMVFVLFSACNFKKNSNVAPGVETIIVATAGMPRPFSFEDDDGTIAGVDPDICKAIDGLLSQYAFNFEVTEFPSVLGGLDSGKYQIGANAFSRTPERAEKYLFSQPIYENRAGFIVRPGYTEIKQVEDIGGKRTGTGAGSAMATFLEAFNRAHPDNPVKIEYIEGDELMLHQKLVNGQYDFVISSDAAYPAFKALFQLEEDYVSLSDEEARHIYDPDVYLLVENSDRGKKIQDALNGAITTLTADGTISRITTGYLNIDLAIKAR
jgi:polar amino acid transport system substrate-binding protein